MKFKGTEVFIIMNALNKCESTKGAGRKFLRVNKRRFSPHYTEAIGWLADYDEEYEELTVHKTQTGEVAAFRFDLEKGTDGYNAFMKHLASEEYEIEPYSMHEDVLDDIDGVGVVEEDALLALTTEAVASRAEAQKEE